MKRNKRYHYERRVPREYADFDKRRYFRKSLKTTSVDVARARRDALVEADDLFWAGVSSAADGVSSNGRQAEQASQAIKRYEGAKRRAMAKGFMYTPNSELIERTDVTDLLNRLAVLPAHSFPRQDEAEAVLGIAPKPSIPITQAFEIYCNQIAVSDLLGKSVTQRAEWKKIKKRSVRNFVKMHGDMALMKSAAKKRVSFIIGGQRD